MKKTALLEFCLGTCFTILLITPVICGNKPGDNTKEDQQTDPAGQSYSNYKKHVPGMPDSLQFAGETVPLEKWYVKELLDREILLNAYDEGMMLYLVKLSHRYFPMIEERLKAHNIPEDMKYLCVAESKLQNAISRAGAVGFWQFMRGTAPQYGLRINNEVDERYHVEKSTDAACKYLLAAYKKFGSWTAAAASYNCGQGGYNSQATFQRTSNYYDLMLPEETNHYLFRILAFKHLLGNAEQLGYIVQPGEQYWPMKVRKKQVTSSIPNLVSFAMAEGSNYKELKILNPWLRGRSLTVSKGQTYTLLLPQ